MTKASGNGVYTTFRCFEGVAAMTCSFRIDVKGSVNCRYYREIGGECLCREAIRDAITTVLNEVTK